MKFRTILILSGIAVGVYFAGKHNVVNEGNIQAAKAAATSAEKEFSETSERAKVEAAQAQKSFDHKSEDVRKGVQKYY